MNVLRSFKYVFLIVAAMAALTAVAQGREPEYRLGSGDVVKITVFQNPDLTLETRVNENGVISYPLVGTVHIGGLTILAAQQAIAAALQQGNFIKHPQVNILLVHNLSSQVSVLGAVNKPGRYPLDTFNTTVSEMVATAGGIAPGGAQVVILMGTRAGKPIRKEIDIRAMFLDNKPAEDVYLESGDELYVHRQPLFYIYGEVQRPGSYRVARGMTIRQALAQGGGLTQRGTERGLRVYHNGGADKKDEVAARLSDLVRPDDVIYVPQSVF